MIGAGGYVIGERAGNACIRFNPVPELHGSAGLVWMAGYFGATAGLFLEGPPSPGLRDFLSLIPDPRPNLA